MGRKTKAWLSMGNIELHLIKGKPHTKRGQHPDDLIVCHLALEVTDASAVLRRLEQMQQATVERAGVGEGGGWTWYGKVSSRGGGGGLSWNCVVFVKTKATSILRQSKVGVFFVFQGLPKGIHLNPHHFLKELIGRSRSIITKGRSNVALLQGATFEGSFCEGTVGARSRNM